MAEPRHEILLATQPTMGKKGVEYPFRFALVVWYRPDGSVREYSSHLDIIGQGLADGHYHQSWESALQEFGERVINHNRSYKEGNISHIPGIEYDKCGCTEISKHDEVIDADRDRFGIQERAEKTRRKLSKKGEGEYLEI